MDLAKVLKERRRKLDVTQADLADLAEVGIATIKDIERGKGNPSIQTATKILDVLGMEIVYQIRKVVE